LLSILNPWCFGISGFFYFMLTMNFNIV
jgi:hypothetical protein